jgi:very-short-patch-repair endonuclease
VPILPTRFTKGQLQLEKIIKEVGLETILEYERGPYKIDIFCNEVNKGFEYDGIGHHKNRDKKRDQYILDNFGIKIMRVTDLKDPDLKAKIKEFADG